MKSIISFILLYFFLLAGISVATQLSDAQAQHSSQAEHGQNVNPQNQTGSQL